MARMCVPVLPLVLTQSWVQRNEKLNFLATWHFCSKLHFNAMTKKAILATFGKTSAPIVGPYFHTTHIANISVYHFER